MEYVYQPPILTVDCVIFQIVSGTLKVLLIKRTNEPFKGVWALPGGYNAAGDTTTQALHRVLTTKVGISPESLPLVEQLYAFDTVARDPRGHAVSVTFMALANDIRPKISPLTQSPELFDIGALPAMAFDHHQIVQLAHERLKSRVTTTTAIFALMPKTFTLTQLQEAYEAILSRSLDKRNFRKKFLSFDLLEATGEYFQEGAHRPALLYRFRTTGLQPLLRDF